MGGAQKSTWSGPGERSTGYLAAFARIPVNIQPRRKQNRDKPNPLSCTVNVIEQSDDGGCLYWQHPVKTSNYLNSFNLYKNPIGSTIFISILTINKRRFREVKSFIQVYTVGDKTVIQAIMTPISNLRY